MERPRFDSPFTRRDRDGQVGADTREDGNTVDLFLKFRQFRPYLKCRLKKIYADNREREFREEVDDIRYFLAVMSDMLADENHGAAALQGFIDRIHEMVRKNPLSDALSYQTEEEEEEEVAAAPRSPSPTEIIYDSFAGPPTTARTIPLERSAADFNYFDSIEESIERGIHDRKKPPSTPRNPWDLENDIFNTHGPSQDIDMRNANAPIFKPMLNTTPLGHGAPRPNHWQESNGNYRTTSFGRGTSVRDENCYEWENRRDKNYSSNASQGYRREDRFSDKSNDDSYRGDGFGSFARGQAVSEVDYTRPPPREREYASNSSSDRERQDYGRDYNRRDQDRQYEKNSFPRAKDSQPQRNQEDVMFERRSQPQFERRRQPSNTSFDGSVHIDYNHGAEEQDWNDNGSTPSVIDRDRDMRYQPPTSNPGIYPQNSRNSYENQNVHMYLNQQAPNFGGNNYIQNSSLLQQTTAVNHLGIASNLGLQNKNISTPNSGIPPGVNFPRQPLNLPPPGIQPGSGFVQQNHPPLVVQPGSGFVQQNHPPPGVQPGSGFVQQAAPASASFDYPEAVVPSQQYPKKIPKSLDSEDRLKEMFKQKALQNFARQKIQRNENHISNNPATPQKTLIPQKSPQAGLLASNQMLSDRDPRLQHRLNKKHYQGSSTSQNESSTSNAKSKDSDKRVELDPRLVRRERERERERDRERERERRTDTDTGNRNAHGLKQRHQDYRRTDKPREDREKLSLKSSGESRDRVARVNLDQPDTYSRHLDDTRNRVKERLPTHQNKHSSKLQEIRKQVEAERFHVLGRPSSKKVSSFDEAIIVPVETPMRPPPKESSSSKSNQKNKDISKETDNSGSQKELQKAKEKLTQKEKGQASTGKSLRQRGQRNASGNDSDSGSKPGRKRKDKGNTKSQKLPSGPKTSKSLTRSDSGEPPKKPAVFRIPKIKKPDPPPSPPKSPSPEPPASEPREPDTLSSSTVTSPSHDISPAANEKLKLITDDFIKQFVMAEMDSPDANSILSNPEVIALIKERLKNQIKELFKDEHSPTARSTASSSETPLEPETLPREPVAEAETGGHQSRSLTKKRNSKRRSSLEKLHDALKEMRFDAMLPLGPRRCTLGQVEDTQESGSGVTTESKDTSKANDVTSSTSSKKNSGGSKVNDLTKTANLKPSAAESTSDNNEVSTVGKKGTKRKRKSSKVKPNKKKKGPVTRAQAAVKSAIKIQHKEKPGQRKRKNLTSTDKTAEETRITRSMMVRGSAIKIKMEPVAVKEEPEDHQSYVDGMEYLEESNSQPEPENTSKDDGTTINSSIPHLELPSFDQDDLDVNMSIDIKSEPSSEHDMTIEDIEEPDVEAIKVEVADTDYNADLSDFLPDIPTIEHVYSTFEADGSAMDLIFNQIDLEREGPGTSPEPRPDSTDFQKEVYDVVECLLIAIEELEGAEQDIEPEVNVIPDNHAEAVSKPEVITICDTDDESEEPNDFFEIILSDDEQPQSNDNPPFVEPSMECDLHETDANIDLNVAKSEIFDEQGIQNVEQEADFERMRAEDVVDNEQPPEFPNNKSEGDDNLPTGSLRGEISTTMKEHVLRTGFDPDEELIFLPNCDPSDLEAIGRITNLRGRDLYKCPNVPCGFGAINAPLLKEHIPSCPLTTDIKSVGCPHCDKRVKGVMNLIEHLKTHGQQKQVCSLCTYRTWATSELTRHMKSFHKVFNHKSEKQEASDPDDEPEFVIYPKDVASRISTSQQLKDSYACYADRLVFGPNDIDKVPNRQIFQTLAYCSSCSYSSKVRVNFCRHLQAHRAANEKPEVVIPSSDPVNPVPCLERKELMFDKMTNWAGSTHEKKQGNVNSDSSALPQFVSEQFRFVCNVQGCEQITVDEYMLRTHIRTLHSEVEFYKCPHCAKNEATRNDIRNTVPVDKLGNHLKLHGPKLYRCAYCDVIHTQITLMEKHLPEKHPERKPIHYLIRNLDNEGNVANRRNSNDESTPTDKWRCALCASKQLYSSYIDVKNHCAATHKLGSQFLCYTCKYNTDDDALMSSHVLECDPNGKILIMWCRSEFDGKPEDIIHGPLWKRSASIKHIRGIFLEDVKEKIPKAEKPESGFSSRQAGFLCGEKITAPATPGKTNRRPYKPSPNGAKDGVLPAAVKLFTCPKCNLFKTKSITNMRVHLYNEMGYQRYRCTKCNVKFVTEGSLKGHMIGDHGTSLDENCFELLPLDSAIENFVNAFFSSEEEIAPSIEIQKSPIEVIPPSTVSKQSMFLCKHCGQECQTAHNLKTHVLAKHIASDRYICGHCKATFWNQALVRNHHTKAHRDMIYSIEEQENFALNITPEFWFTEYGLPLPLKKGVKRFSDGDNLAEPAPTTSESTLTLASDLENSDDFLFDFTNCDIDPALITDVRLALSSNGTTEDSFLQQLLEDTSSNGAAVNRSQNPGASYAYKCFHCGENSLSVRGARSHWEKVHSDRPEERCNYYEYRAFNQMNQLPPCIQLSCSICDYTVSCLNLMHDHHDLNHSNLAFRMKRKLRVGFLVFECGICFHECSTKEQVLEHVNTTHPNVLEPSYITTDLREKMEQNPDVFMGRLVEDTVRYACDDPVCVFDYETRAESQIHMLSDHGIISRKVNIKYNRYIINPRIRVPVDDETVEPPKIGFQCPMCDYQAEERQKLVTEHLGEHVHTYICPTCLKSFRSYVDTKFHIRQQHADPNGTPLINREMVKARENLENSIIQVQMPGRKPTFSL